jgi:hypothetical protein
MSIGFADDGEWREFSRALAASGVFGEMDALAKVIRDALAPASMPAMTALSRAIAESMPTIDYSQMMRPLLDDFKPFTLMLAEAQADWLPNIRSIMSDLTTTIATAEARAHSAAEPNPPEVQPEQELRALVTPGALRPLSPAQMKKTVGVAGFVLSGWWGIADAIDYLVGEAATPADELMWAAAIMFALTMLIVSAVDFDRDE